MPTWCSAISIPRISWAAARRSMRAAADAAIDRLAAALKVDRIAAAEGVHRVVNTNMAEGIRLVSVRRGVDPRRFALLSFGGAAGLHVTDVARQLDLTRVVVPRVAAVLSAWGMLATDLRFEVSRTHIGDTARLDGAGDQAAVRRDGAGRAGAAARLVRRAGARAALGGDALRRADLRDHRAARRHRLGRPTIRCRRSSSGSTTGTRSSTPTRCASRMRCW